MYTTIYRLCKDGGSQLKEEVQVSYIYSTCFQGRGSLPYVLIFRF